MKKLGFITEDLDAKCSVGEYNMYRKYLQKVHGNSVKREIKRRSEVAAELRDLEIANTEAQKEITKLKNKERKLEARSKMLRSLERQAAEKRRQQIIKQKAAEERRKVMEVKKKEQKEQMILRAKLRAEHSKQRRRRASEKERQKIIGLLLKWRKKERERTMKQEAAIWEAELAKRRAVENKWIKREMYQAWLLNMEKFIIDYADGEAKNNIEKYMAQVERERERIKKKIKNTSQFLRCFSARHSSIPTRSCCEIGLAPKPIKSLKSIWDEGDSYTDRCAMTELCRCDVSEHCMDLRQWPV